MTWHDLADLLAERLSNHPHDCGHDPLVAGCPFVATQELSPPYSDGGLMTDHPAHDVMAEQSPGFWEPSIPLRCSWWQQWKRQRACHRAGGHWWHSQADWSWSCCRCGANRDGSPRDGDRCWLPDPDCKQTDLCPPQPSQEEHG